MTPSELAHKRSDLRKRCPHRVHEKKFGRCGRRRRARRARRMRPGVGVRGYRARVTNRSSQLAAAGHSIPIIFITAYGDQESRRQGVQAGAIAFLYKPFSDAQLLKSIRSAFMLKNGDRDNEDSF